MDNDKVATTVYMHDKALVGFVSLPHGRRLSDFLNGRSVGLNEDNFRFITLTDVTIYHRDGTRENAETAYVNKSNIELLATLDGDLARGIGAQKSERYYPFVSKTRVRAGITMPDYDVAGYLHCTEGQNLCDLLEGKATFLPLTDASIHTKQVDFKKKAMFCAINKELIGSLRYQ